MLCLITCFEEIILFIGSQPPPPDAINSAAEFSHTHYTRDDDLISLQIEPHRLVFYSLLFHNYCVMLLTIVVYYICHMVSVYQESLKCSICLNTITLRFFFGRGRPYMYMYTCFLLTPRIIIITMAYCISSTSSCRC